MAHFIFSQFYYPLMPVNIHDSFFKAMMADREVAISFLDTFLPIEVKEHIELATLQPTQSSYVDDELSSIYSDAVFTCALKGDDSEVKVTVLLEHKSYKDDMSVVQLLAYMAKAYNRQWRSGEKQVAVIPLLFYHGKRTWEYRPFDPH